MKITSKNTISQVQLTSLLIGVTMGIGILSLPREVTKICAQDAWIAICIIVIYPIIGVFFSVKLMKEFKNKNIMQINRIIIGTFMGNVVNTIIILEFVIIVIIKLRSLGELVQTYILYRVPLGTIMFVALVACVYPSILGLKVIARINQIIHILFIPIIFFMFYIIKDTELINIMPIGGSGIKILEGAKACIFAYLGYNMIWIVYPYINKKEDTTKSGILAIILTMLFYTSIMFISIIYMGVDLPQHIIWPLGIIPTSIEIPVVETFQPFFLMFWTFMVFKNISIAYFCSYEAIKNTFNINDSKVSKIVINILMFCIIYFAGLNSFKNIPQKIEITKHFTDFIIINDMILPIMLLIIYFIFRKSDKIDS